MTSLGQRLRQARNRAGLRQHELASRSGVKQQTISNIERRKQRVSHQIVPLAHALGVSLMWLQYGQGTMVGATEEEGSVVLSLKVVLTGNDAALFRAAAHRAQCTPDELMARILARAFDELAPAPAAPISPTASEFTSEEIALTEPAADTPRRPRRRGN